MALLKKWGTSIGIALLFFLLQTSVFRYFTIGQAVPNLLVLLTCTYGLLRGEHDGIYAGFCIGLLLDAFYMDGLGVHALIYLYIGYLSGLLHDAYRDATGAWLPMLAVLMADMASLCVEYLLFYLMRGDFRWLSYLRRVFFPELIYTVALAVPLFPAVALLERRFVRTVDDEEERARGAVSNPEMQSQGVKGGGAI